MTLFVGSSGPCERGKFALKLGQKSSSSWGGDVFYEGIFRGAVRLIEALFSLWSDLIPGTFAAKSSLVFCSVEGEK
jgi:hypothetical protein